jgi:hypothetical protein
MEAEEGVFLPIRMSLAVFTRPERPVLADLLLDPGKPGSKTFSGPA